MENLMDIETQKIEIAKLEKTVKKLVEGNNRTKGAISMLEQKYISYGKPIPKDLKEAIKTLREVIKEKEKLIAKELQYLKTNFPEVFER